MRASISALEREDPAGSRQEGQVLGFRTPHRATVQIEIQALKITCPAGPAQYLHRSRRKASHYLRAGSVCCVGQEDPSAGLV